VRRVSALLACASLAVAAAATPAQWRRVETPLALSFPRDDGAHPAFLTEWWYATAIVHDPAGHRYGVQLTLFRRGIDPSPPAGAPRLYPAQVIAAHLAVADVGSGGFRSAERVRRADGYLAWTKEGELDVAVDGWRIAEGADSAIVLSASDVAAGIALDLTLVPAKPRVCQGDGGVSRKGPEPGDVSAYVSWTRLATRGTITARGRHEEVEGTSWFDHEWGTTELGANVVGWDWLGLHLDDGRDLMVYRLRRADGGSSPYSSGTLVGKDGSTRHLGAEEIEVSALGSWTSPTSHAAYPAGLRVRIPGAGIDVTASPLVASCEVDGRASTGTVYWEGPVRVSGSATGEGYMELTGYAGTMRGVL
jgi:predicted secreted hydrolase